MKITILGAGSTGLAAAVELSLAGHDVSLWNRSKKTLISLEGGDLDYSGVLGSGTVRLPLITADLKQATADAEVMLVCLPTLVLNDLANNLIAEGINHLPILLNPGYTGGALEFAQVWTSKGIDPPQIVEFSTHTYVSDQPKPGHVNISSVAQHVWVAPLPGGQAALDQAVALFPNAEKANTILTTSLANVNIVLHPPGAILGASRIEQTGGNFTFFVQGLTDGVSRIMSKLDQERLRVGAAYGLQLPDLIEEMQLIGSINSKVDKSAGVASVIRSEKSHQTIKAPDSLFHHFYMEDFWYGLQPLLAFARIAGVDVPIAQSLMDIASVMLPTIEPNFGRNAESMGIENMSKDEFVKSVT